MMPQDKLDFLSKDFKEYKKKIDILANAFTKALVEALANSGMAVDADLNIGLPASIIAWTRFSDGLIETLCEHPDKTISKAMKDALYDAEISALEARLKEVKEKMKK